MSATLRQRQQDGVGAVLEQRRHGGRCGTTRTGQVLLSMPHSRADAAHWGQPHRIRAAPRRRSGLVAPAGQGRNDSVLAAGRSNRKVVIRGRLTGSRRALATVREPAVPLTAVCLPGLLAAATACRRDPRVSDARAVLAAAATRPSCPAGSPRRGPDESSSSTTRRGPGFRERRRASAGWTGRSPSSLPALPLSGLVAVPRPASGRQLVARVGAGPSALAGRARRGEDAEACAGRCAGASARRALRIGPLTDVEGCARQGRFGEAIHLLLSCTSSPRSSAATTAPAPAQTNREVLARTRWPGRTRAALGVLVSAAEMVHFGGREAAREDYENCLGHYRRFPRRLRADRVSEGPFSRRTIVWLVSACRSPRS